MAISFPYTLVNGPGHLADATQVMANLETLRAALEAGGYGASSVLSKYIATEETRENTAYGTLTTPDEVTILMPSEGLIAVGYQATWQESSSTVARAAIFLGSNQIKVAHAGGVPVVQEAALGSGFGKDAPLVSFPLGLLTPAGAAGGASSDVTTGQVVGGVPVGQTDFGNYFGGAVQYEPVGGSGGACLIFVAAGTYAVSVRFKASSGKVTAKNRKLWVWVA